MYAPFIELSYWGSSTGEQKKKYLSDVKAAFTLNSIRAPAIIESPAQLQAIPIGNLEDAEDRYACYPQEGNESLQVVPEPTHVLRVHAYLDTATAKEKPSAEDEGAYPGDVGGQVYEDERGYLEKEFAIGVHDGKYYFCTIKQE